MIVHLLGLDGNELGIREKLAYTDSTIAIAQRIVSTVFRNDCTNYTFYPSLVLSFNILLAHMRGEALS